MRFAGSFSSAFLARYICPVMAQSEMLRGAVAVHDGSGLLVGDRRLIGPSGKIYAFVSRESCESWAARLLAVGRSEEALRASLDAAALASWQMRKRAAMALLAARLVTAAARQDDAQKRGALIAESVFCLAKWQ